MSGKKYVQKSYLLRYLTVIVSIALNGLGVSLMRISCLGTDPFNSMNYSFSELFHVPLGLIVIAVSFILLILSFFTMKSSIGFGTAVNMLLLGTSADIWTSFITASVGHEFSYTGMEQLPLRLVFVCIGILCMIFFNSFYISADLGMAPYDALGFIVEKLSGGRLPFQWARIIIDSICVITAFIVAGKNGNPWELIGVGTVIMAFGTGPLLAWFKKYAAEPFIHKICNNRTTKKYNINFGE